jgi:hypothetical protein
MPGERRGGRQLRTPNRRTVLTDRVLALASKHPDISWTGFLDVLARDKDVPADTRVEVLKSLSSRGRQTAASANRGLAVPADRRRARRSGRSITKMNTYQLEGFLRVVHDDSAAPKHRRKAALAAAQLLLPVDQNKQKWGALKDKFGIAINPAMAREYRDIKLRLEALRKGQTQAAPIVRVEIRKLEARRRVILDRVECPCPATYGVKHNMDDCYRLNHLDNKRRTGKMLTCEEDAEEAHRRIRADIYDSGPEMQARRRRKQLERLAYDEWESRVVKIAEPIEMTIRERSTLELLRRLYPDVHRVSSRYDLQSHDEFKADESAFACEEPNPSDGYFHASQETPPEIEDNERLNGGRIGTSADEPAVDFEAWLRGTEQYQPFRLREAANKLFGKTFSRVYPDLVIACVEANILPTEKICPQFREHLGITSDNPRPSDAKRKPLTPPRRWFNES